MSSSSSNNNNKVAYLGPPSSYSHQAALEVFASSTDFYPQTTFADILSTVQSRQCDYGVIPFENSTNGSVIQTLDLFCDRQNLYPDVLVCGEAYLDVHHCLLSSGIQEDITRIYSHPQAFGQSERWLNKHLKGVERVDVSSTSKAATVAKMEGSGTAAIASRVAAEVQDLSILAADIEDSPDNTTRFFILSATEKARVSDEDKTLLSFTIDHSQPGALCDSLKVFKDFGLNLTSIASRPGRITPWNYVFFVEFVGHAATDNAKDALRELGKYTKMMRVLGSYRQRHSRTDV